jgi:hypothetical protein
MAEQEESIAETQRVVAGVDLVVKRALANGDEAHRETAPDHIGGCREQVRVVLLLAVVGDGSDHDVIRLEAERGTHLGSGARLFALDGHVDAVHDDFGAPAPPSRHRVANLLRDRKDCVVERARHRVQDPGRERERGRGVVFSRHDPGVAFAAQTTARPNGQCRRRTASVRARCRSDAPPSGAAA